MWVSSKITLLALHVNRTSLDMKTGELALALAIGFGIPLGMAAVCLLIPPVRASAPRTYENVEEWEIIKDPETGRTKGIRVHRNAKQA
jgi:hypothetical protein